jgi:hypothetical protein
LNEFRALDPRRIAKLLKKKVLVDLRNIYKPEEMAAAGLNYESIGRPTQTKSPETALSQIILQIEDMESGEMEETDRKKKTAV